MNVPLLTLAYADIFDYPLTKEELYRWRLRGPQGSVPQKDGFYFLKGRGNIVAKRKAKRKWQREKWEIGRIAARYLSWIPWALLVGVTGGLAMNNAKKEDDIDLFIITSPGRLWTTRFVATILLWFMRRHPGDLRVANKICLNMFVSTLALSKGERDLFSAHEVLQMEPLFVRGDIYKQFLQANIWVKKFLPNAWRYRYDV